MTVHGLPASYDVTISDAGAATWPAADTLDTRAANAHGATSPATGSASTFPDAASMPVRFGSHVYELTPAGRLPATAHVTITLDQPVPEGTDPVVVTRATASKPWTYLPARLSGDRARVTFRTTHFSFFGVLLVDAAALWNAFKDDFIDGLTGGVTAAAEKPSCENEAAARSTDFHVNSSTTATVFWCFGYDHTTGPTRVLKVVNNRRYPILVQHPNMALLRNHLDWTALSNLSRLQHGYVIIEPRQTAIFNADLTPGTSEGIITEFDGFGQSLYALQTGVESLLDVLTRFGFSTGRSKAGVLNTMLSMPACVHAVPEGSGAVVKECLDAKALVEAFGPVGMVLAPLAATGSLAQFFASELEALSDLVKGNDRYAVTIRRDAPDFTAFAHPWGAHTSSITISSTGAVHESIGNGCCDPIIDVWYQLSNPRQSGSSWLATATVSRVAVHDWMGMSTAPPRAGGVYTVRATADHYWGVALPAFQFCDSRPPYDNWDCGA